MTGLTRDGDDSGLTQICGDIIHFSRYLLLLNTTKGFSIGSSQVTDFAWSCFSLFSALKLLCYYLSVIGIIVQLEDSSPAKLLEMGLVLFP